MYLRFLCENVRIDFTASKSTPETHNDFKVLGYSLGKQTDIEACMAYNCCTIKLY